MSQIGVAVSGTTAQEVLAAIEGAEQLGIDQNGANSTAADDPSISH